MTFSKRTLNFTFLFIIVAVFFSAVSAQPATPASSTGRQACGITINRSEPGQITNGEDRTLTITGSGFTEQTTIRLGQFGALTTTFVSPAVLTGAIPASIPGGTYNVRIVDPACPDNNGINYPDPRPSLTVFAAPPPSLEPEPVEPPTEIPGSPSLIARNFIVSPPVVAPGGTVVMTVEIFNQGNRTAEAVSVAVSAEGSFLPVGGSVILPNIVPNTSVPVTLSASVAQTAEGGPAAIPITITYRDFTGETYESQASGSVTIEEVVQSTQLVLESYPYEPNPAIPGEPVTVRVTVKNTGNTPASQALFAVAGDSGVLLAGPQGDTFPLSDLQPGQVSTLELPLIVSPEAKPGPQSQPYSISFLLNGEAQEAAGRMTINVARVAPAAATMLLSHSVDKDPLEPGDQFELTVELENVGEVGALGMLVTFGTVEETGGNDDDEGSGGGSSTTPSTTFAPLGTGGTLFVGDLDAGDTTTFEQMFIVNGTTTSGIYSLPITLRYQKPDGTSVQDNLRATVVVIKLPPLQVNLVAPPPEFVTVGEPIALTYDLVNSGATAIELTNATTEAENGEVVEGAETLVGQVPPSDQGTYTAVVIPNEPGTVNITVTIRYLDDLNNEREIVNTYEAEVAEPPPPIEEEPTPDFFPVPTEEPEPDSDWVGHLLLGLLGLGS